MTISESPRWSQLPDSQLMKEVHLDDPDWLETLFSRHRDRFQACAHRMVKPGEVEDATQEISERILKGLPRFRGDSSLGTWIFAVARNTCFDVRRRRKPGMRTDSVPIEEIPTTTDPADDFEISVLGCRTAMALRDLPEGQAQVVLLRLGQGLSTTDTASRLGITRGAVKSRLLRARRHLRAALAEAIACPHCGPGTHAIHGRSEV